MLAPVWNRPPTPRRSIWIWVVLGGLLGPFTLIVIGVLVLDRVEDAGHSWVSIDRDPIARYVPLGMHPVVVDVVGWSERSSCHTNGRCSWTRLFASPLDAATAEAEVERELAAAGFVRREPNRVRCPAAKIGATRYVRGEISVWPTSGATPYPVGRSHAISATEGAAVIRFEIDNFSVPWGC